MGGMGRGSKFPPKFKINLVAMKSLAWESLSALRAGAGCFLLSTAAYFLSECGEGAGEVTQNQVLGRD